MIIGIKGPDLNKLTLTLLREALRDLYNVGHATFPNATVHVPLINYSHNLPIQQQRKLKQSNELIKTTNSFIPGLEKTKFNTMADNMDGTPGTAHNVATLEGFFE